MGSNNTKRENDFKNKVKKILDDKSDDIKQFIEKRYEKMKESEPNNEKGTLKDKPIIYKINPNKHLFIEIFNFPALLREENGLFTIVNRIYIIFKYFSDKMKNKSKDEYEKNFQIFLKVFWIVILKNLMN